MNILAVTMDKAEFNKKKEIVIVLFNSNFTVLAIQLSVKHSKSVSDITCISHAYRMSPFW